MRKSFTPLGIKCVKLTEGLLGDRQRLNERVTVPHIYGKLVETGRIESLRCDRAEAERNPPHPFWDSDVGKTIEAVSYSLVTSPNEELETQVDAVVDLLEREQYPDGYLNTYFRTSEPERRWTNLYYMHELYCAGHLIEGAVAYYEATGKRKFLDIMKRYADHILARFGAEEGKTRGYCGHPEIELALVRLHGATGDDKYLQLARYFIDERGRQPYYFEVESLARGVDTTIAANQKRHLKHYLKSRGPYAEYQAQAPVREQREPVGHAVRAMYLYSGMTDVAAAFDDEGLFEACRTIWNAMVETQYYITGGIGPSSDGERFTFAFDLPNEYTYNESCAAVAQVMWAHRMLQFECDGGYADVLEQTLYNTVLASVSREGDRYFYANYLSVYPEYYEHSSASLIDKMRAERQGWFDVACCPPNISRLIGSLGTYLYSLGPDSLHVHLYAGNVASFDAGGVVGRIVMSTDYPWDGAVRMVVDFEAEIEFDICLRIPHWCADWSIRVNGAEAQTESRNGYRAIRRRWKSDVIELVLAMPVMLMEARSKVRENCGRLAIKRGPIVYCIEEADNGKEINGISLAADREFKETRGIPGLDADAVGLEFDGLRRDDTGWSQGLYREARSSTRAVPVKAIPYFLWGNRGFGEMLVWIRGNR